MRGNAKHGGLDIPQLHVRDDSHCDLIERLNNLGCTLYDADFFADIAHGISFYDVRSLAIIHAEMREARIDADDATVVIRHCNRLLC